MKELIKKNLDTAVNRYLARLDNRPEELPAIEVEHARDPQHGDLATNIAMVLAGGLGKPPRDIAQGILDCLPETEFLEKTEIAGPGFINFHLSQAAWLQVIPDIFSAGDRYGKSNIGQGQRVHIEFVSSNPTGPVHIGHGRGAAYGSVLANLLETAGFDVTREYYVNDAGRQMDILAASVCLRCLQISDTPDLVLPDRAYQGEYVRDIASRFLQANSSFPAPPAGEIATLIESAIDEEKKIDRVVALIRETLGDTDYRTLFEFTLNEILAEIRTDLEDFSVTFDNWFSERSLIDSGAVESCLDKLEKNGEIYVNDGAKWFHSSRYGDEKDRVVVRDNGQITYFASDIAYHVDKFERGFDQIINLWGADHHGYIARVRGALNSLGKDRDRLRILLVQFATLYRGKQKLQMSTRSGEYVTLKELREEVGRDAARFFYVTRKAEQHLDFDLELAKSQSSENPVYYVQYAHARICSVFRQLKDRGSSVATEPDSADLTLLTEDSELELLKALSRYNEILETAAINYEPHLLAYYLRDLANHFHTYYNSCQFIVDDMRLCQARLCLITATRQVIKNALDLLGVSSPEQM